MTDQAVALEGAEAVRMAQETLADAVDGLAAIHLNACVRCGLCAESCHIYLAEPEPENHPGTKVGKVLRHYRRYHTFLGKHFPGLFPTIRIRCTQVVKFCRRLRPS